MSHAKPADPQQYARLHNLVEGLCIAAGLPKPRVYVVEDPAPNAFATGRNPANAAVAATTGILRVLSERSLERVGSNSPIKVDVRVIAATNKNLKELVANGTFREDLYFRLNVVKIKMPPLRDRREDIVLLANSFLQEFAKENDRPVKPLTDAAMGLLLAYSWPGNVRELRTAIEHGVVMSNGTTIEVLHLPQFLQSPDQSPTQAATPPKNTLAAASEFNLNALETKAIRAALALARGNRTHASELLGLSRRTLQRKLKDLGI
jgi:DNA-binding NtrC family response regulator